MKLQTLVVAALAALMLAGCSSSTGSTTAHATPASPATPTSTTVAESACVAVGGTVGPDQICHVQSATSSYTLDFSFPVSYPDQQALTDFLTHERDQEVEYAQLYPPTNRPLPYEFKANL